MAFSDYFMTELNINLLFISSHVEAPLYILKLAQAEIPDPPSKSKEKTPYSPTNPHLIKQVPCNTVLEEY